MENDYGEITIQFEPIVTANGKQGYWDVQDADTTILKK